MAGLIETAALTAGATAVGLFGWRQLKKRFPAQIDWKFDGKIKLTPLASDKKKKKVHRIIKGSLASRVEKSK